MDETGGVAFFCEDNMQEKNAYEAPRTTNQLEKQSHAKEPSIGAWLLRMVVVLTFIGILIGSLLPTIGTPREVSRRTTCLNNIRQLSIAMHSYASANGHFPPAYIADENGKPIHSWRVLILPYIEQEALYKQYSFDEPWDGPNNSKLHDVIVPGFQCPSVASGERGTNTSYMLLAGAGTAFDCDHETAFSEVADGTTNTVLVVEVANSDTHWMEPVDISLDEALTRFTDETKVKDCCNHPGSINVSLMDGSTHSIHLPLSSEDLKAIATIDGEETVNINDL
jgi:type II secretory pathway pseudopilin PulG